MHVSCLGFDPFAHHYLGHLVDFFSVRLLRCFTSPTSPLTSRFLAYAKRVAPFGDLRINVCLRLPEEFRCLLRPSSLSDATASPVYPYLFFLSLHHCLVFNFQLTQGNFAYSANIFMVEMIGFEPTTYGLQSHRSPTEPHPHVNNTVKMVGRGGFEPPTSRLSAACSNQLSYRPLT